jgi:hypothetical protein
MATDFRALVEALCDNDVEFAIIGGVALVLQGAPRTTVDLDISYARSAANLERLARALAPFAPRLRGAPEGLPFQLDARTLRTGLNFTLTTDRGDIDLLGEVTGVGDFDAVASDATILPLYGREVRVMSLATLERAKRAAGRLKDLTDLAHIVELRKRA